MDPTSEVERFIVDELMLGGAKTKLDPNESLVQGGILDSLGILRLVSFLEERFAIRIDDLELVPESFDSIKAIVRLLEKKVAKAQS